MTAVLAIYLYGLAVGLLVFMVRQHQRGQCELICIRNFAFLGFIVFQLTNSGTALWTGSYGAFQLGNPSWVGLQFAAMTTIFIVVLLWAYRHGWGGVRLAGHLPKIWVVPSDTALVVMALVITAVAWGLRFGVQTPLVGIVTSRVGLGLASVACGLVAWVWGRRLLNPIVIALVLFIVAVNLANVMTGAFGRRGVLAVGAAVLWGMYYSHWRYLTTPALLRRLAIASIPPLILVALFTAGRTNSEKDRTPGEQVKAMVDANFSEGAAALLSGQGSGVISMWVIENYPANFEYLKLITLRYFFLVVVPRDWWPDKPLPLSNLIASQASVPGVNQTVGSKSGDGRGGVSLSPGIIGHAVADGGWPVVFLYAVLIGIYLRFFDEIVYLNAPSPFLVIPIGASLGQIIGLARGETSVFAMAYVMSVGGSMLLMILIAKFLEHLGAGHPQMRPASEEDYATWDNRAADDADLEGGEPSDTGQSMV